MRQIVYSPDSLEDIRNIKKYLRRRFGADQAKIHTQLIRQDIQRLKDYPELGITTEEKWGIPSPYRVLTISHNYVFYFVKGDVIHIVDVFDERMDIFSRLL